MYSFALADGWASEGLWALTQASIEVDAAAAALDAADAAFGALVADTAWDSDGVRMLNDKLVELGSRAAVESAALADRSWELQRAGA